MERTAKEKLWNKLSKVTGCEWFDTSNVTNMSGMFYGCTALNKLDVSRWNTSKVTDMSYMFSGCESLTELDVSRWDISKVENTEDMFIGTKWESNPPYPFNQ